MKIDISLHFSVKCKESENVATEELIQRISRVTQVVGQ
ncbi:hypothetical protein LCGC14_1961470 [marine sediment metagenome]|uniref:Uncharacterized protein n=1 Tax=marine sediment metagenome TaxID=412755 RepID=A0A0F9FEQ4_9ZZZZ